MVRRVEQTPIYTTCELRRLLSSCIEQILLGLSDGKVKVFNVSSQKVTAEIPCGQDYPRLVAAVFGEALLKIVYVCLILTVGLSYACRIISLACHPVSGLFACSAATDRLKVTTGLTSPNLPSSRSAEMLFKVNGALSVWDLSSRSNKVQMSTVHKTVIIFLQ